MMERKKAIRYAAALAAILLMAGAAEWSGEREILFPEMVALTVGLWIIDKRVWAVKPRQVVTLLTSGALAGVCIVRCSPMPLPCNLLAAFALAGCGLLAFRSTLIPLISACVLPVLLHTHSFVYPAAVALLALLLAVGRRIMERCGVRSAECPPILRPARREDAVRWALLIACVGAVALPALLGGWPYLVLPPLLVAFVEMVGSKAGFRNRPTQVFLFLVTAATLGTVCRLAGDRLGLPLTAEAFVIAGTLFLLFEAVGKYFAPAGALAFIPLLLPMQGLAWLPLQAAVGAVIFITIAMVGFQRCYTWSRAQIFYCALPTPLREYLGRRKRSRTGG